MATRTRRRPKAIGVDGEEIFDTSCVLCFKNRITTDGIYHCKYCGVLCETCASKHQKTPKKKGHWAMKFKTIIQAAPKTEFKSVTNCEIHVHEKLTGYCIDCGELFCDICFADTHSDCITETLETISANLSRENDMREARVELEDIRKRTSRTRKNKRQEMKYLSKQADDFMDSVFKVRQKVNEMFDNMIAVIVKDKDAFCNAEAEIIENHELTCKEISPIFDQAKLKLNKAYQSGNTVELWLAITKLQRLVTYLDDTVTKIENDKCDVKFEFVPSASLSAMLKEPENVGRMRVITSRLHGEKQDIVSKMAHPNQSRFRPPWMKRDDDRDFWDPSTNPMTSSRAKSKLSVRSIEIVAPRLETPSDKVVKSNTTIRAKGKKVAKSNYSFKDDQVKRLRGNVFGEIRKMKLSVIGKKEILIPEETTDNCITGSTYLPNGRLVFVDYNNKNLKLFTSNFEMLRCKTVEERPWDVTSCYKTVIAVSYPFVNTVEIVETESDMKVEGQIKTDRKCRGVAFHSDERWLYVACGEGIGARLQAYSLDGYVRKVIIPLPGVLHEPCFLTMSPDSKKVFISDLDNGIVGFDTKSGEMICQYKDPKIKRYWDLTVDADGRVLILTTDPDCLYVIMGDHNGQLLSTFNGKEKVCSVCFDQVTKNLVITRWKKDEVETYHVVYS